MKEEPTIIIHVKSGCIVSALANVTIEMIVLDCDTATCGTPNIPGFGNVGFDCPDVPVSKTGVRAIRKRIEEAEREYENTNHHRP